MIPTLVALKTARRGAAPLAPGAVGDAHAAPQALASRRGVQTARSDPGGPVALARHGQTFSLLAGRKRGEAPAIEGVVAGSARCRGAHHSEARP